MDIAYEETEALLLELQLKVEREYRQAAAEMQEKLIEYQNSFKKKNIKKLEQLRNGEITADEYEYWYKGQVLIGQRWIDMRDQLAEDMTHSNEIAMSIVSDYLPEVYAINHNYATFEIEMQSRLNTSYTLYSRETVERLLRDDPDLLPRPSVRVTKDMMYNKQILTSAVTQSILQGEDIYQLAARLRPEVAAKATAEYFGVYTAEALEHKLDVAAMRTARTMMTSVQNGGRIDGYKRAERMGLELRKVWLATPDSRVRDSHARLDGEERETEEEFSNGCRYPGDPNGDPAEVYNCRCTLISQVKGTPRIDVTDLSQRHSGLSRDYDGDEEMTYQDWKDYHSKDPDVRREVREKWRESEIGKLRRQRYYGNN